ncbi:RnfH family protein [Pseudomonas oryzihabitans]|uniref:RnfH family protein n=1 Tax=Pseudomonas oryzihabitans TaxID=47885 RepID=UPI002895D3B9|nr:RnfH family protein [Pseudomonas oryzihabitans]MDT3722556.1 RnfH family protein [Pseudomonas oryzihabitans]
MAERLAIEVALALPERQWLLNLQLEEGTTVEQAVLSSGLLEQLEPVQRAHYRVGIFGKLVAKPAERKLVQGDRVEIYRPLLADPKESRKRRAEQARLKVSR